MQPPSGPRMRRVFLATRFGRRIFLMFCLAALVPAVAVFWMTWRASTADAEASAMRGLQETNKSYALGVFQRLYTARQALAAAEPEALREGGGGAMLSMFFSDVVVVDDAPGRPLPPRSRRFRQGLRDAGIPSRSEVMVLAPEVAGRAHDVVLLRRIPGNGQGTVIAGRLDRAYLWGNPEEIGNAARICVQAEVGARLFCGGERDPGGDGARRLETEWTLFIKPQFEAPDWVFTATTEAPGALAHYRRLVAPVMVGILLLAMLLSSLQIRRVVGPLEALLGRIRAFGGGGPRTGAAEGDEFGLLSDTFDDMRARITQQLDTLRILSEIDHLILARVPLEEVIELVIARIAEITDGAGVCVLLSRPEDGQGGRCHARARGAERSTEGPVPAVPPALLRMSPRAGTPGVVLEAGGLGPAAPLLGGEAGRAEPHVWAIALGGEGETRIWLLLGRQDDTPLAEHLRGQVRDLAERIAVAAAFVKHQDLLLYQARHDLLTGLPNRLATFEALAEAIEAARPSARAFAVAFVDLDRFKAINDGLGHALGDDILVQSGERIRASLGPEDFVGRFGGDEFFVILRNASGPDAVVAAMARVDEAFSRPIVVGHREFHQRFSAGVAFFPRDGVDASVLVRNADVAMYRAKQTGGARTAFFETEMNRRAEARMQMENELRVAIQEGQIELHYQPRVDSRDDRIIGVEALARWMHPTRGIVPPDEFIGLAEECGLIEPLGKLVLDKACRQMAEWQRMGFELGVVGVNISGHQLRSGRLRDYVREAIAANGIPPARLELEVTETMLVLDSDSGMAQLQAIRELGVKVAIDDFGTGYSSLAYLTRLPSDTLKIDRAFVIDLLEGDPAVEAVVRSIIAIARDLGKGIVAEGLESMEQVRMLGAWGCHVIQGYVYARPLTANGITGILLNGGIVTPAGAPESVATPGAGPGA